MTREDRKKEFTQMLAHFLVDQQAGKSILLQIQKPSTTSRELTKDVVPQMAIEWAGLRASSGLHGYPTYEEALKHLEDLLQ